MNLESLGSIALQVLKEHLEEAKVAITEDLEPYVKHVAEETARYALAAAGGEERAKENMAIVKAKAGLLAAIAYERGYQEGVEMLKAFAMAVARTLGVVAKAAIL
jgi:hypothetical protein